jgi:type IV pilus assembly protein PilO
MVETTEDYYAILPIEIRLTGDFHGLGKFMEKVSRMQHLITVDVSIVPSSTHENQLVMASLLKAYRNNMTQRALK